MNISKQSAIEFLELHNQTIQQEWANNPVDLVATALESYPYEYNGMGGFEYEIPSNESKTGNPIIYTFPITMDAP